jgi:hypothetical protein
MCSNFASFGVLKTTNLAAKLAKNGKNQPGVLDNPQLHV